MLRMSAAQHEKWEWSMSFLNGSCWGELLHWKHINPFTKTNGEAVKWWRKTSPVKMTCPTQTDSWHFTPQSTIKSLFISGTRLRKKEGGKNCLHDEFYAKHTHISAWTHTCRLQQSLRTTPDWGSPSPLNPPSTLDPQAIECSLIWIHCKDRKNGPSHIQTALHPLMNVTFSWYLHAMHDAELACQTLSFRLNKA